jgi:hypothetical protein
VLGKQQNDEKYAIKIVYREIRWTEGGYISKVPFQLK